MRTLIFFPENFIQIYYRFFHKQTKRYNKFFLTTIQGCLPKNYLCCLP